MKKFIFGKAAEFKTAALLKTNFFTGIFLSFRLQISEHLFVAASGKWKEKCKFVYY